MCVFYCRHHATDVRKNVANYHLNGESISVLIVVVVVYVAEGGV